MTDDLNTDDIAQHLQSLFDLNCATIAATLGIGAPDVAVLLITPLARRLVEIAPETTPELLRAMAETQRATFHGDARQIEEARARSDRAVDRFWDEGQARQAQAAGVIN